MNVYLMGYMGSGKTTVGRKLAKALRQEFLDLDEYIAKTSGKSIDQLLSRRTDKVFRKLEQVALHYTTTKDNLVVSTGGGTPCFFDNIDLINKNGVSVYLQATPAALASRLENATTSRPLIAGKSGDELEAFITEHLGKREKYYEQAHIIEPALGFTPERYLLLVQKIREIYFK